MAETTFTLPRAFRDVVLVSEVAGAAHALLWKLAKRSVSGESVTTFARRLNEPGTFHVHPVGEDQIRRHAAGEDRGGVVSMTEKAFNVSRQRMLPRSQRGLMARAACGQIVLHELIRSASMILVALPAPAGDGFVDSQCDLNRMATGAP